MKSIITSLVVCTFALTLVTNAQEFKLPASKFQPIVQLGLLNGSKGTSADLHAIAGFALKPVYLGLGTGIDYYRLRSVPVFASIRRDFGKIRKPAFIYANLGYNYDWLTEANKAEYSYNNIYGYKGGLYYDIGFGGRLSKNSNLGLTLGAGYTFKQMTQEVKSISCPFIGPCFTTSETYKYNLGRLVIRAGWIF